MAGPSSGAGPEGAAVPTRHPNTNASRSAWSALLLMREDDKPCLYEKNQVVRFSDPKILRFQDSRIPVDSMTNMT